MGRSSSHNDEGGICLALVSPLLAVLAVRGSNFDFREDRRGKIYPEKALLYPYGIFDPFFDHVSCV